MFQAFDESGFGQRRAQLVTTLRDRASWPTSYEWDFANCNRCAMGLAHDLGWIKKPDVNHMAKWLGLDYAKASKIFVERSSIRGINRDTRPDDTERDWAETQPEDVAADLEALVEA